MNCQRIWDTSLQSVSFSPKPLDEESTEEIHPVPSSEAGTLQPRLGGTALC